jgi:hypothetical protein
MSRPRRMVMACAALQLLAAASCAQPPSSASVAIPPVPASEARVWFYREAGPYEAQDRPYIRMNDQIVGISEPRGAFYRDVPPGHYHVAVEQYLSGDNQTRDVDLSPGQQVYFKIVSLENWISGGSSDGRGYSRPAFYVWQIPNAIAQGDVAQTPFTGGG